VDGESELMEVLRSGQWLMRTQNGKQGEVKNVNEANVAAMTEAASSS
jgi:hypothetical protein